MFQRLPLRRGFQAAQDVSGRVTRESALPGLAAWGRVRDYRVGQIAKLTNVEVHTGSRLSAQDVLDTGTETVVVVATRSRLRGDRAAYTNTHAILGSVGKRSSLPMT